MNVRPFISSALLCLLCVAPFTSPLHATETEHSEYWGYHLILDCQGCDLQLISEEQNIRDFVKVLVEEIDMKAYGEPILANFATHNPLAAGYSLVQLIETSSITAHFAENTGEAYLDIFSCKAFDIEHAKSVVSQFFKPTKIKTAYLTRQA